MDEQSYNLKYTGKEIDDLLDKANDMNSSAQVPTGGTSGQVLTKKSGTDYDAEWKTPGSSLPSGGTPSQVLTKKSTASGDAEWRDVPVQLPSGGSAGQALVKNSATNYDVKWETIQSGGGSSGESDLFVIKVTGTSSSDFSSDKTYDEMLAAYRAGKAVIMVPKDITTNNYLRCLPLGRFYSYTSSTSTGINTTYDYATFASPYASTSSGSTYSKRTIYYINWVRASKSDGTVSVSLSDSTETMYSIPYGGKTGQLLSKKDDNPYSYNMQWIDPPSGGGGGGGITKTALWVSSTPSLSSQNATDLTLNDNIRNYKIVYAVFTATGGSLITGMQFLNIDKPHSGSYMWTLFAENGNSRAMRLVNDTSIHVYDGQNNQGYTDATACIVTGIYGIK